MRPVARPETRHGPSIRRLLAILLGALVFLIAALFLVTTMQLRASAHESHVESRRTESFLLADTMRQSSNNLTLMVRLYVSTGDPNYRRYYNEILAIRAGTAPRPANYDSSFWDRVLANGEGSVTYGPPESLVDQMKAANFTADEFAALNTALSSSNQLAQVEVDVINRAADRVARGVDPSYAADVAPLSRRLVDASYLSQKSNIMRAIAHFTDLVDQRTLADVQTARADGRRLVAWQIAILGVVVLVSAGALLVTKRLALRPLDELTAATRRIADGDYAERADVHGVSELERVADAFNAMVGSVQADVAARERAEHVAIEAQQAAEEASRAKSSFLAAMSHEIRTPMIGVTGMLEVLAQTELTRQQQHMVSTAQNSAAALLQIIGDTLDFSKIEAGKLEIDHTTFAIRDVVEAAVGTFIHTASAKGLGLSVNCDSRLAAAHLGDPLRVRQIVSNFLSNAVKFTESGGIELAVRVIGEPGDDPQLVEISATDTGVGLSAEQQDRLFQEFTQAEASTTQRYGGTGLGLVICRRLAVLMGGEVSMRSQLGRGTTMRLTLPLLIGDPAQVVPDPSIVTSRFTASRRMPSRDEAIEERSLVLVAEDHSVNRAVLLHQLDIAGARADFAENGQEALDLFQSGDYAMVITDLHMPVLDGYGLARGIRLYESQMGRARTPIMALTANVLEGEAQRCREAGMDDFATKPTTIALLAAKLRTWLPHVEFKPRAASPSPEQPISGTGRGAVDRSVLDELTDGDESMTQAIIDDFVDSSTADLAELERTIAADDVDEARRMAHRIKGAAAVVGARRVAELAASIERDAAEGGAGEGLRPLLAELASALASVVDDVSRHRSAEIAP